MTQAIGNDTAEVTLSRGSVEAILEAVRVLGVDLGSLHPMFRMDLRLAAGELYAARGFLEIREAMDTPGMFGVADSLGYLRCLGCLQDARSDRVGHRVDAILSRAGQIEATDRCDSCGDLMVDVPIPEVLPHGPDGPAREPFGPPPGGISPLIIG